MQKSKTRPRPLRYVCGALACTVLLVSGSAVAAPINSTGVFNASTAGPVSLPFGPNFAPVLVNVDLSATATGSGDYELMMTGPLSADVSLFITFPNFSFDVTVTDNSGGNGLFNGSNSVTATFTDASFSGAANGSVSIFGFTEDPTAPNFFDFLLGNTVATIPGMGGMPDVFIKIDEDNTDADFSDLDPFGDPTSFEIDAVFTLLFAGDISTDILDPPFEVFLSGDSTIAGVVIPVPAAAWLFASALGMLGWARRRAA